MLLETDDYAFEFLSELAGRESWRKENFRPIYHLVCRKRALDRRAPLSGPAALTAGRHLAITKAGRLLSRGLDLSRNDRRVILYSQFLAQLGPAPREEILRWLEEKQSALEVALDDPAFRTPAGPAHGRGDRSEPASVQRLLFDLE